MATEDEDLKILKSHALQLAEHFDTVQIITTRLDPEEEGTFIIDHGEGNWFARYGSVMAWLRKNRK